MIISWRGSTVYAGLTFTSTASTIQPKINFGIFKEPTKVFEYNAQVTQGNLQFVVRRQNGPTNVFEYNAKAPTTWTVDCECEVIWSKIGPWIIAEIDGQFWTPSGLLTVREFDDIIWDVHNPVSLGWKIQEVDGQSWVVNIDGTRENCITGDGEIDTLSVLLAQIW